jgi:CheY-like chemotaxis protein
MTRICVEPSRQALLIIWSNPYRPAILWQRLTHKQENTRTSHTDKILVIDDDAVQRALLSAIFRKQGLEVLQAANGQEGIRLARDRRPDLIVSDVNLPEMHGFAVLENLRKEPITATIPVILITANPDEADQRRARESGASGYLPKPISISDLQALVNAEMGKTNRTASQ